MVFGLSNKPIEALKKGLPKKEGSSPMQSIAPMQSVNPTPLKKVMPTQSYGGFEGITKPLGQTAVNPSGFGEKTVATNFPKNVQQQIGTQVAQSTTQPIQQAGNQSTVQGSLGTIDISKGLTDLTDQMTAGIQAGKTINLDKLKEAYPEFSNIDNTVLQELTDQMSEGIKAGKTLNIEKLKIAYPELTVGQTQQPRTIGGKTVDELHGTGPIGGITRTLQEAIVDIPNWAGNLLSYGGKISGVLDRGIDSVFGTNLAEQATKFDEKTKAMGLEPNVGAYGPKTTDYLQNKLGVDKEAISTTIGNFVSEMTPFLIPGAGGLEVVNFATKLEKAPGIIKIAKESPNLYKFVLKPVLKTVAKDLPQSVLGAQEYAMMSRAENTNPTEIATALAMSKVLNGIIATPGAMKWIGKELYGLNVRPSTQEAKAIQSFEAGLSSKAPRTTVDTALETGSPTSLVGRRSGIGTDAEREANKIFEKEINPIVQSIDEGGFTKKVDDIGAGAKKRIDSQNISEIEKAKSKEVVDEIIEDMKQYGGDEMNLQQIGKNKSALDSMVSKKAQEKGYSPKVEQNAKLMVADEMRNIQHSTISKTAGIDSATKFKDWYNLSELSKIGIKARTEGTMPVPTGGSFVGMRAIFDTLLTPITSTAGKFLYRAGKYLTIEGPKGLGGQTLGSIIKNNGGKIDQDGFLALPSPETVSKSNIGTPQNPIVSKGLQKKDILEINNLKNGVANSNNRNLLPPSKQVATDLNKINTNPKPQKQQGLLPPKQEPKPIKQEKNTLGTPLNKTVKAKVEPLPNKNNPLVKNKLESKELYHGTNADFKEFIATKGSKNLLGDGIYATTDTSVGKLYGDKIKQVNAKIDNVYKINKRTDDIDYKLYEALPEYAQRGIDNMNIQSYKNIVDDFGGEINSALKKMGYDGIEFPHKNTDIKNYVIFDPKDVKMTQPKNITTQGILNEPKVQAPKPLEAPKPLQAKSQLTQEEAIKIYEKGNKARLDNTKQYLNKFNSYDDFIKSLDNEDVAHDFNVKAGLESDLRNANKETQKEIAMGVIKDLKNNGLDIKTQWESKGLKPNNISVRKPTVMMKTPAEPQTITVYKGMKEGGTKKFGMDYYALNETDAAQYGNVSKVNIKVNKLADFTQPSPDIAKILEEKSGFAKEFVERALKGEDSFNNPIYDMIEVPAVKQALKDAGYDAVKFKDYGNKNTQFARHDSIALLEKQKPLEAKVSNPVVTIKDPLIQEARKYKSAEDMINGLEKEGKVVYHGTNKKFDKFSKDYIGENQQSDWGDGISFTDNKNVAKSFAEDAGGDIVMKVDISNIKFADGNKLSNDPKLQSILDDGMGFQDIYEDYLKPKGYDGIKFNHGKEGGIEYIVYDVNKIKTESQLKQIREEANSPGLKPKKR